jgi:hypothetical protein
MYRVYDAEDRLIYVGATHHLPCRMGQHQNASWWHCLAARIQWDFHPTKDAAFAAETVAIQEEQPAFNIRGAGRAENDFGHWTADDLRVCKSWIDGDPLRLMYVGRYLHDFLIPDGPRFVIDPNRVFGMVRAA